jgi:hypothetical protein
MPSPIFYNFGQQFTIRGATGGILMRVSRGFASVLSLVLVASSTGALRAQLPVTDGLQLWLDATDASTLFEDDFLRNEIDPANVGGPVGGWRDKSPNRYEVFQADPTRQPSYHDSAMNGQPSVRFTGAEADGMEIFGFDVVRPYTIFIANQYWGDTRGRTLQGVENNWLLGLWNRQVGHFAEPWVSNPNTMKARLNTPFVEDTVGTETSSSFFLNGEDFTADSAPLGNPGGLGLVSHGLYPAEVSDADISEIIVYDRALDQSELDAVRSYLYEKYGTTPFVPAPPEVFSVQAGIVGRFTGAEAGESMNVTGFEFDANNMPVYTFADGPGLDFEGEFVHAFNVGGPAVNALDEPLIIGDATFMDGSPGGLVDPDVTITSTHDIPAWVTPVTYGDSPEDDNLEFIMQSIRWSNRGQVEGAEGLFVDAAVEEGEFYKVQLLFMEECCNRGFDIFVEGEEVVSNMVVQQIQGGITNETAGVVYTHTFQATDDQLNILLGGRHEDVPDNNPILHAFTLELVDAPPPMGIPGDYNGNGTVEQADLDLVLLNWGTGGVPGGWTNDLPEGNIDQAELDGVLLNWGNTAPLGSAGVPEPSALLLAACVAAAGIGMSRRRRR